VAKNNETRFFYVLYSDKTWVFDQSERAQGPIYIIKLYNYEKLYNYYLFLPSINKDWLIDWLKGTHLLKWIQLPFVAFHSYVVENCLFYIL